MVFIVGFNNDTMSQLAIPVTGQLLFSPLIMNFGPMTVM